jgi:hypothetical protein
MNFILLYNQLINQKINIIINNSISEELTTYNKCIFCSYKSNLLYYYKKHNKHIKIKEIDYHTLIKHNNINYNLYEEICKIEINVFNINFLLLHNNNINVLDGLYNIGSNKIFFNSDKNLSNNKIFRYSENYGHLIFKNNKLHKIISLNKYRISQNDNEIFLPENDIENLNYQYFFHTHPVTPFIGSRSKDGIIFEFPSISDILNFIEHHNMGKLQASIVITPEGMYIIRKNNFNNDKIVFDEDIFFDKIEDLYRELHEQILFKYKQHLIYSKSNLNTKINIKYFYKNITSNLNYIIFINEFLQTYDIAIDFYTRNKFIDENNNVLWLLPNIYLPNI